MRKIYLYILCTFYLTAIGCTKPAKTQDLPSSSIEVDVLFINGDVYTGELKEAQKLDIGIKDDKIVFIGNANSSNPIAKKTVDISGYILSPGFIDPHTHTESSLSSTNRTTRSLLPYIHQGVTTVLTGNDGYGAVNTGTLLSDWDKRGIGTNVGIFIGFGAVRTEIMGTSNAAPTATQILQMQNIVDRSMKDGAFGLSTGLSYLPQNFSTTDEVKKVAFPVSKYKGIYDTHMRTQGATSIDAINEVLAIGEGTDIRLHISHIKASGKSAWGMSTEFINYIKAARGRGVDISANVYPYLASGDALKGLTPEWARIDGNTKLLENLNDPDKLAQIKTHLTTSIARRGADAIVIAYPSDLTIHNKSIETLATEWGISNEDVVVRVLKFNPGTSVFSFVMSEEDLRNFIKEPWIMTGSDGTSTHPRAAGTFAKMIGHYAIREKLIDLKSAIHRSTGLTAETFKIKNRGFIREGYYADIVVFDPQNYIDQSSYANFALPPTGVKYVYVNGKLVIEDGSHTGLLAGKAIRFIDQ